MDPTHNVPPLLNSELGRAVRGSSARGRRRRRQSSRRRGSLVRGAFVTAGCAFAVSAVVLALHDQVVRRPEMGDDPGDGPTMYLFWAILLAFLSVGSFAFAYLLNRNRQQRTT